MIETTNTTNSSSTPQIKIIGVGGGGNNTINSMIQEGVEGVEFIAANTDQQALNKSLANTILPLGKTLGGLGAGANPEKGKQAAIESETLIKETLNEAAMVIISAGMGGGTGTGAAPIIAQLAKKMGILTVGVVTTPFKFEGTQRAKNASYGLDKMRSSVDSLIVISNEKLLEQFGGVSIKESFIYADKILKQTIRTMTDLITLPTLINLDFADVTTIMKNQGTALIGIGKASGDDRAAKAAIHAISSPILETSVKGAKNALINISGGNITLGEAQKAVDTIQQASGENLNIIFGVAIDENLDNEIQVSVIATGLESNFTNLSSEEIKNEVTNFVKTLEINFDNEKTRETLLKDVLPEEEKMTISDELELQDQVDPLDEVDEEELPSFLQD